MDAPEQLGRADQLALLGNIAQKFDVLPTPELNAGTLPHLLTESITPTELLFVRNTGGMPNFSPSQMANWTLLIDGHVRKRRCWTIEELKAIGTKEVIAVLECAGNGRAFFRSNWTTVYLDSKVPTNRFVAATRPIWRKVPWAAGTVMWRDGAAGCVKWTGVPLAALLKECGLKKTAIYTGHHSIETKLDSRAPAISRGLPIAKAMAEETLVAWAMNDEKIPPIHGGPLRLVVPGYPGSAWHKWIDRIEIRDKEHDGRLMDEYRIDGKIIEEMPVNSVITSPKTGFEVPAGEALRVGGYAWSGGSHIEKACVSVDKCRSWREAILGEAPDSWFAWRRFDIELADLSRGPIEITVRASDHSSGQPLVSRGRRGNRIGYCNNVVRRVAGRVI
jgi:sulfite oxidase